MAMEIYSTREAPDILNDMLDTVPDHLDKREGGIIYDMQAPAALEVEMLGYELDAIMELGWIHTSEGVVLTDRCAELGVDRKDGEFAKGQVLFKADPGVEVELGATVYTRGEVAFTTDYSVEVPESGEILVAVTAAEMGTDGNIMSGEIFEADPAVENIISVSNPEPFEGGVDVESDDALKSRYYQRVRKPITSGNPAHYESLALEVKGVGAAKPIPTWAGPGTVKVIIASEEGGSVTDEVVTAVEDHILAQQIIGADATIVSVETLTIDIAAKITMEEGFSLEDAKLSITESLKLYFVEATREGVVRYAHVANAIIDALGVVDHEELTVNGGTANILVTNEQSASVGAVVLSA